MKVLVVDTPKALPAIVAALRPLHDRVLIEVVAEQPKPGALILVKDNGDVVDAVNDGTGAHSDYRRLGLVGKIIAVGPGKYDEKGRFHETTVVPGQKVIFTNWNDWEGAPPGFAMVREADIWGSPCEKRKQTRR